MATPSPNASRIDRRFDVLRSKAEQDIGAQQQKAGEGLARQAVAQGNAGSGVQQKLASQQQQQFATQKQNAINDVESQREAAQSQADEIQAQRDFAKAEREAGQQFATGERLGQQEFASYQAKLGREFESGEAAKQRGFSEKLFNKDMAFKDKVRKDNNAQFAKQFGLAMKQFDLDTKVSEFNMDMANKQWNKKDLLESMQNVFGYDPRTGGSTGGGYGSVWSGAESAGGKIGGMF